MRDTHLQTLVPILTTNWRGYRLQIKGAVLLGLRNLIWWCLLTGFSHSTPFVTFWFLAGNMHVVFFLGCLASTNSFLRICHFVTRNIIFRCSYRHICISNYYEQPLPLRSSFLCNLQSLMGSFVDRFEFSSMLPFRVISFASFIKRLLHWLGSAVILGYIGQLLTVALTDRHVGKYSR